MALQIMKGAAPCRTATNRSQRVACFARASGPKTAPSTAPQQARQQEQNPLAAKVLACGLALGLSLGAHVMPVQAEEFATLPDIVRSQYDFVRPDKNGVITKEQLKRTAEEFTEDSQFMVPGDEQLDFAVRLFDLNQDGLLTADELLTSLVLDGAVSDDALDASVWQVFDKNKNGKVDLREWRAALPPLGPNGDGMRDYIFTRVDGLVGSKGEMDQVEFANALALLRTAVLGY